VLEDGVKPDGIPDGYSRLLQRGYSRRQILRFGVAAVALPTVLEAYYTSEARAASGRTGVYQLPLDEVLDLNDDVETFTPAQLSAVQAVLDRLIPSDDAGPGASEAKVWRYIDRALAHDYSPLKPLYDANLAALDSYAKSHHGKAFADLAGSSQDAILTALETGKATGFTPTSADFFLLVREHALEGMFGDPYHGGNAEFAGWNLIEFPGILDVNPLEYQKLGVAIPLANRSVAQFPGMFDLQRGGG
jgi:hypothetical protein